MKIKLKFLLSLLLIIFLNDSSFSQVQKVDAVSLTVSDMDQALKFYTEVLSFNKISDNEFYGEEYEKLYHLFGVRLRIARLQLGEQYIDLTDFITQGGRPIPVESASNDLWFQHIAIVVSDMDKAYKRLKSFHVAHVSTAPQTIPVTNKAAAGIKAFYFQDPDHHNLELIWFPTGKGKTIWQKKDNLFLGIDHTAIAVSATEISKKFYTDILGLQLKGESFNYGTEQAHLNNVKDASLHISGMAASSGPGVEFLEYKIPGPGNKYPAATRSDDLIVWRTIMYVDNADALFKKLKEEHAVVSDAMVTISGTKTFIAKDPDDHQVQFFSK